MFEPPAQPLGTHEVRELVVDGHVLTVLRAAYSELDSTNLQARRLWEHRAASGLPPLPVLVVAETQTAGMGRRGRSWQSPQGGLWMSFAWPLRHELAAYQALPLVAGLSVLELLTHLGLHELAIKWPNDVLAGGRKIAGVLCQSAQGVEPPMIVVGIGVDVNVDPRALQGPMRTPPTSVLEQAGHPVGLRAVEESLVLRLLSNIMHLEARGFDATLLAHVQRNMAWIGHAVRCSDGDVEGGTLLGIDDQGRLLLDTSRGLQRVQAGEISLSSSGS